VSLANQDANPGLASEARVRLVVLLATTEKS
jgi:hypothetical protein